MWTVLAAWTDISAGDWANIILAISAAGGGGVTFLWKMAKLVNDTQAKQLLTAQELGNVTALVARVEGVVDSVIEDVDGVKETIAEVRERLAAFEARRVDESKTTDSSRNGRLGVFTPDGEGKT